MSDPVEDPAGTPDPEPTPDPPPADPPELGDAGRKALAEERAARKAAEKEARRAGELEAELAQVREEAMSEQEKAIASARKEAAAEARHEALGTVNRRLFTAEVRAAAAGKLSDPDLLADADVAMRLLKFDEIPVNDQGDVDAEAISAALDSLVESKPYLAVGDRQPVPGADQGARGGHRATQLTREKLKTMTPLQIDEAHKEGRLDEILGRS